MSTTVRVRTSRLVAAVLLVTCAASSARAQSAFEKSADALVDAYARDGRFSGAVLVSQGGTPRFERAYGLADRTWDLPNTPDTRFEIGSLTKAFTAMAVAQLAAAGKLGLDDPVGKYYARAPEAWKTITIHQLLTHTSGIPGNDLKDYSKGITVPYTPDELIETFHDRPLGFEPGAGWQYTNTEYVLLAYVIEKVSKESYSSYLSRHIFDPLNMQDTGLAPTNAIVRRQAEGYTPENGVLRHRDYFDRSLETGAGGLHSTLADLSKWDQALYTEQLVPKACLDRVFSGNNKGKYGYGWFVKDDDGGRRIYHGGSEPGYSAFLLRRPERHLLVVVLANIDQAPVRDIAEGLEKLAAGESGLKAPGESKGAGGQR